MIMKGDGLMKKILLIGTGGTIASLPGENGLVPQLSIYQLLEKIPQLKDIAEIEGRQLINADSTNIRPTDWLLIAEEIKCNYDKYDGFVITHGTDTMAYTAAGLNYLIQNSVKPIIITGAQVPLAYEHTDAIRNLTEAIIYACDELSCGVQIVFSGAVILGSRARKNYTKRFDAFCSVNYPEIARISGSRILRFMGEKYTGEPLFYDKLNTNVGLLKLIPGMKKEILCYLLENYDGLVIEGFGTGGIPEYYDCYGDIISAVEKGKTVIVTTQVPNEGSDSVLYEVGNLIKKTAGLMESYDMTSEACLAKLMWVLGQSNDPAQIKKMFYTPVGYDMRRSDPE